MYICMFKFNTYTHTYIHTYIYIYTLYMGCSTPIDYRTPVSVRRSVAGSRVTFPEDSRACAESQGTGTGSQGPQGSQGPTADGCMVMAVMVVKG